MSNLTRRGLAVVTLLGAGLMALFFYLMGHIWYVQDKGYCLGSMAQCYDIQEEAK